MTFYTENTFEQIMTEELFYQVIDRLKAQDALPQDSFLREIPFFNLEHVTKEQHVKELFNQLNSNQNYQDLLKRAIGAELQGAESNELIAKRLSAMQVLNFAQITLYKVLPCPHTNCPNKPREIATHNQYKDFEYECPFYHHERDRRRLVITGKIGEEFIYKANYFEENKGHGSDKTKYS